MSDLIERQDVIDAVHYYIESGYKCDIFQELKDLPSAEPERKTGKWIKHIDDLFPEESMEECSECHEMQFIDNGKCDKYCPNCGADMRGEK